MPISRIGRNETIGPAWATSKRPLRLPSWKIQTVMPIEAAMLSRNPAAAFSGTRIERNTTISSSSARPTTTAMYIGSASDSRSAVSMLTAVWPVT